MARIVLDVEGVVAVAEYFFEGRKKAAYLQLNLFAVHSVNKLIRIFFFKK